MYGVGSPPVGRTVDCGSGGGSRAYYSWVHRPDPDLFYFDPLGVRKDLVLLRLLVVDDLGLRTFWMWLAALRDALKDWSLDSGVDEFAVVRAYVDDAFTRMM